MGDMLHELEASLIHKDEQLRAMRSEKVGLLAEVKSGERMQGLLKQQLGAFQHEIDAQQQSIDKLEQQNRDSHDRQCNVRSVNSRSSSSKTAQKHHDVVWKNEKYSRPSPPHANAAFNFESNSGGSTI